MFTSKSVVTLIMLALLAPSSVIAGSWQNNQSIGGFSRVNIYTPDTESSVGQGRALLLVLHGCTQSIDAYLGANLEQAAEAHGMVIAVPDAANKAGFGCWSYWQGAKSRSAADYQNLITLATTLTNDSTYNIDADQVYISGLSSGAAFANTTACLAPDIFAGMGISAGPSIGTSSSGALGVCEAANVALRCEQYAGSFDGFLDTQIASIAFGDADTTVDQCYNRQNAEGMADVYGVSELPGSNQLVEGSATADEFLWEDKRVSMLWFNGVDHAWSGGSGASGSYINGRSINYAMYLGQYFKENNLRLDRNQAPELSNVSVQEDASILTISGNVSDADSDVESVNAHIRDLDNNQYQFSAQVVASGSFTIISTDLADALYFIDVNGVDSEGAISETVSLSVRVGPPPPNTAPTLENLTVNTDGQCATVSGTVIDINQDLATVTASFATGDVLAVVSGDRFSAQACDLAGGSQSVSVTANDVTALSTTQSSTFIIDAGALGTLDEHIAANRLDFTNYANCYLEYGGDTFKLNEVETSAQQCTWQDDDASCVGPEQICTSASGGSDDDGGDGSGGNGDGTDNGDNGNDETCVEFSTTNYSHKLAGRAYSTGNFFAPDYFASGSNDALSGSTWGISNLFSTDDEIWELGQCP